MTKQRKWVAVIGSKFSTTLITVFGGGLIVAMINCHVQRSAKERELSVAWQYEQSRLSVEIRKRRIEQRDEGVREAIGSLNALAAAAENLMITEEYFWKNATYNREDLPALKKQKEDLRNTYNVLETEWNSKNEVWETRVFDLYPEDGTRTQWRAARNASHALQQCMEEWLTMRVEKGFTIHPCRDEAGQVRSQLNAMAESVQQSQKNIEKLLEQQPPRAHQLDN